MDRTARRALLGLLFFAACGAEEVAPPVIVSFTASATKVGLGDPVNLSWKVANANSVGITATPGGSLVEGSTALENTIPSGPITAATRFTLSAKNAEGVTVTAEVMVSVDGSILRITRFVATPAEIEPGASATLSWAIAGQPIGKVRVVDPAGTALYDGAAAEGDVMVSPTAPTTYTLEVSNVASSLDASVTVTVRSTPPIIRRFTASPNPAVVGTRGTVSWETERADEVQIRRDGAIVRPWTASGAAMGFTAFTFASASSIFTLEARNAFGTVSQDLPVNTLNRPTATLTVTPERFTSASSTASISWMTTNASTVTLTIGGLVPAGFTGQASGQLTITTTRSLDVVLGAQNAVESVTREAQIRRVAIFTQDVVDQADQPLLGAAVRIEDGTGARFYEGVTDAAGRATIEIEAEMFPVSVSVAMTGYRATAVVGLDAPMADPILIAVVPPVVNPPMPVISEVSGGIFAKSGVNNRVLVGGIDVEGYDGGGVTYTMRYIVSPDPLTLVALEFGGNDRLINAVVATTTRTEAPASMELRFPRPVIAPQSTVVSLRLPTAGVFMNQRYTLAGQAVVKRTPGKNDIITGDSVIGAAVGGAVPWTIDTFPGQPGLEADAAGLVINGSSLRITALQRALGAPATIDVAPLATFALSARQGLLTDLRLDFAGPDYDAMIVQIGTADASGIYRVVFPTGRAHRGARIPRLPSTVGLRGLGVPIGGTAAVQVGAYALGDRRAYQMPFEGAEFGFPIGMEYLVERLGGDFATQGF